MIIDEIKKEQLNWRKTAIKEKQENDSGHVFSKLLTTLIGEAQQQADGKIPSDEIVLKTIKKFIKNARQILTARPDDEIAAMEINYLESYLPKSITEDEVNNVLEGYESLSKKDKIAHVKEYCLNNDLLFDGRLVSSMC